MDGVEFDDEPAALLAKGSVANVPVLLGSNKNEGSEFIAMERQVMLCQSFDSTVFNGTALTTTPLF